ncbi:MAG: ribonuclease Z [Bacteroidales bacterium]|nr:ribonuclease Z [Bacteroidales bacterium]
MDFSVTILGSNAAKPTMRRFSSAQVLQTGENLHLIDCAEGTQIQMERFHLKFSLVKTIFISHLHGDHVFGLPGLLSTFSMLERTAALDLYAPPPLENWLNGLLKYFPPLSYPLHIHPLTHNEPTVIHENKQMTVTAFPLKHRVATFAYLFREKEKPLNIRKDMIDFYRIPLREIVAIKAGSDFTDNDGKTIPNERLVFPPIKPRSYAYCSDTAYLPAITNILHNTDLLYHEATFADDNSERAVATFHSTARQAAQIALDSQVEKLIIGHFSSRYDDISVILREAQAVFPNTEAAEDGKVFRLPEITKRRNE